MKLLVLIIVLLIIFRPNVHLIENHLVIWYGWKNRKRILIKIKK